MMVYSWKMKLQNKEILHHDDLMCIQVSPGKAYVAGYDVEIDGTATIDVEKPRDTQNVSNVMFLLRWDIF